MLAGTVLLLVLVCCWGGCYCWCWCVAGAHAALLLPWKCCGMRLMLLLERGELTYLRRTLAMATTMPAVLTAMLTSMRVRGRCCAEMPPRVACKGVRHGRGGACERARTWGQVAD